MAADPRKDMLLRNSEQPGKAEQKRAGFHHQLQESSVHKLIQNVTVLAALGALAPIAAQAGLPGLTMYQPGPIIVHMSHDARMAIKAVPAQAQVANQGGTALTMY